MRLHLSRNPLVKKRQHRDHKSPHRNLRRGFCRLENFLHLERKRECIPVIALSKFGNLCSIRLAKNHPFE